MIYLTKRDIILYANKRPLLFIPVLICLVFLALCPSPAPANDPSVVCLQSMRIRPYDEALEGFKSRCTADIRRFILSESEDVDIIGKIRGIRPGLILAIGQDALHRAMEITDIPVVYLMAPEPSAGSHRKNICGISMQVDAQKQVELLSMTLPDIKNIGVIHSPAYPPDFIRQAASAAARTHIRLITQSVSDAKQMPEALLKMTSGIDAFWMLPDMTIMPPEIIEYLMEYSVENRIPLISFSRKYIDIGAVISISTEAFDMGRQAWQIAERTLSVNRGAPVEKIVRPRKAIVSINQVCAEKLCVTIDPVMKHTAIADNENNSSVISNPFTF